VQFRVDNETGEQQVISVYSDNWLKMQRLDPEFVKVFDQKNINIKPDFSDMSFGPSQSNKEMMGSGDKPQEMLMA